MPHRTLRIAIVAPLVTPIAEPQEGGSQALVADLAVGLTERGHLVDVYAASGSSIDGAHVVDTGVDAKTLVGALFRPGSPRVSVPAVEAAFDHVFAMTETGDYDVVHSHGFDPAALRRSRAGTARVIHTVHLPPEPDAAAALLEARGGQDPAIVVGVSESQARQWRPIVPFDLIIRNGVPVGRIPWSHAEGAGLIFAGRLSAEKGAREAVEIALRAGQRIDLYGSIYDVDYARALEARYRGSAAVRLHGPVPRPELWRHLAKARAVLCPIDWDEPFGLVAAEAQAAGTPVVGFARGALAEVVADGTTGFLVEPGNIDAAVAAIGSVAAIERRACRQNAVDNLNMDTCVAEYEDLYAAVAARTAGTSVAAGTAGTATFGDLTLID
jgi:UDP-glucose:tetrahydrobiopterin glucosyltransferase